MNEHSAVKIFCCLGTLFGLIFLFATPPFQVPDEIAHFFRAYQISTGHVRVDTTPTDSTAVENRY